MNKRPEYKFECCAGKECLFDVPVIGRWQISRLMRAARKRKAIMCETPGGKMEIINFALITRTTVTQIK